MPMDMGYLFLKSKEFKGPGFESLRITLREDPTRKHYDPLLVSMRIAGDDDNVSRQPLTHPWKGPPKLKVCEGRVMMEDWRHKTVYAYTLGGELSIWTEENRTEMRLLSCAPIFPLHLMDSDDAILANRLQMELARIRAVFQDDGRLYRIIASLDACQLYIALLESLRQWLTSRPYQMRNTLMVRVVTDAIRAMKAMGLWADDVVSLAEMFHYPEREEAG